MHRQSKLLLNSLFVLIFSLYFPTFAYSQEDSLQLNSEAAILIDATTGQVLFDKHASRSMYPASITKILTGIIALEEGNLQDTVTVSQHARYIDGTRVYLVEGEQVPLLKLVQGLLINSGNDAGIAIAEYFDQSETAFAQRMNRFAQEKIGVTHSNFTNPHGLYDAEHQTTAYDMAMITRYALNNELFREIVSTKEMEWIGEGWQTTLYNHNKLLWRYEGVNGVKNGYVDQSGHTLVTSAKRDDMELIAVTLKATSSENAYSDTVNLLDYGFANFQTNTIPSGKTYLDANEHEYRLADDINFTSKVNEQVTSEVNESGELLIRGEDQQLLVRQPLVDVAQQEIAIQKAMVDQDSLVPSKKIKPLYQRIVAYVLWVLMLLFLLFLFLLAFLLARKHRLHRKLWRE